MPRLLEQAASARVAPATLRAQSVVFTVLDGFGAQEVVQLMFAGEFVCPLAHRVEHVTLDLDALVANRGVMERPDNVIHHLVHGHIGVLPSIEDAAVAMISNE